MTRPRRDRGSIASLRAISPSRSWSPGHPPMSRQWGASRGSHLWTIGAPFLSPSFRKVDTVRLLDLPTDRWTLLPGSVIEVCSPDREVLLYQRDDGVWDLSTASTLLLVRKVNRPGAVWPITPLPIRSCPGR